MTEPVSSFMVCEDDNAISSQLKDFWKLEDVAIRAPSVEDSDCENHFVSNTVRNNEWWQICGIPTTQVT